MTNSTRSNMFFSQSIFTCLYIAPLAKILRCAARNPGLAIPILYMGQDFTIPPNSLPSLRTSQQQNSHPCPLWLPTFPLGATALEAAPVVPATVVLTLTVLAALRTTGRAVVPATVVAAVVATTSACGVAEVLEGVEGHGGNIL